MVDPLRQGRRWSGPLGDGKDVCRVGALPSAEGDQPHPGELLQQRAPAQRGNLSWAQWTKRFWILSSNRRRYYRWLP
jgi:hypothetical protein